MFRERKCPEGPAHECSSFVLSLKEQSRSVWEGFPGEPFPNQKEACRLALGLALVNIS